MVLKKSTAVFSNPEKYVLDFYQKLSITLSFFNRNELRNHAAAGAYYLLLSLIPLVLLLFYLFDTFLKSYPVFSENLFVVLSIFHENLTPDFFERFGISRKAGNALGVFGILNLFISSRLILASIQRAFSVIFPAEKKRNFLLENAISLFILPFVFITVVLISVLSSSRMIIFKYLQINGISTAYIEPVFNIVSYTVPAIAAFGIVYIMYRYLPVKKPSSKSAVKGAVLFLFVFVIGRFMAHFIFKHFVTGSAYGILGTFMIVMIWAYFVFLLFFFCAQYTFVTFRADILILNRLFNDELPSHRFIRINKKILGRYTLKLKEGDVLVREGEESTSVFYMLSGALEAYKGDTRIGIITFGEVFGEMSLLMGEPRAATVKAKADSEVIVLPPEVFNEIIVGNAEFSRRLMQVLCMRLKTVNEVTLSDPRDDLRDKEEG